jgi:hypothetical protein
MDTGGPFPGGKARPGRDADHSSPSSAEVVNEYEPYLLSPQATPWRVAGLLYFLHDKYGKKKGEGQKMCGGRIVVRNGNDTRTKTRENLLVIYII